MNPQDPLANLHPLREATAIGLWPLAPGWWVLAVAVLIALVVLGAWLYRRYRANAYRRQALAQLQELDQRLSADGDVLSYTQSLNALLKGTALAAYPREQLAAMHGAQWLAFLRHSAPGAQFPDDFSQSIYRGDTHGVDTEQLRAAAKCWLDTHRVLP